MPTLQNDGRPVGVTLSSSCRAPKLLRLSQAVFGLLLALFYCPQFSAETLPSALGVETSAAKTKPSPSPIRPNEKKWGKLEGYAAWYPVPVDSLAKRRAGKDEFTAAHNRLPLGTLVRVTHLANGKSVVVRITDRGVTGRRWVIDLCKEAAATLAMLSEGSARVRLEILPDDKRANATPAPKITAHP